MDILSVNNNDFLISILPPPPKKKEEQKKKPVLYKIAGEVKSFDCRVSDRFSWVVIYV